MKQIFRLVLLVAAVTLLVPASYAGSIFSGVGGVCMNVRGGIVLGADIIAWPCDGGANSDWVADGTWIKLRNTNYCIGVGSRSQGAHLQLQQCNNNYSTQNFAFYPDGTIHHNSGYVVDLEGVAPGPFGTPLPQGRNFILWSANGGKNQHFYRNATVRTTINLGSLPRGAQIAVQGKSGTLTWTGDVNGIIASGGGNIIASGGGNIIASGGGNVVASGGGN